MLLLSLDRRQLRGLGLVLALTLGFWTWQASPTQTGHRALGLVLTAIIIGGVLTSFGLPATASRTQTRIAFVVLMACSVGVTALLPNGPGTAGVYFGAARGSRLGRFGLLVTLVAEAAYLSALILYQGGRPSSTLVTNGLGILAVYVGSFLLGRLRESQVDAARAQERER